MSAVSLSQPTKRIASLSASHLLNIGLLAALVLLLVRLAIQQPAPIPAPTAEIVPVTATPAAPRYAPVAAQPCAAANSAEAGSPALLVRSAPAESYAPFGLLSPGQTAMAIGRTGDGWLAVAYGEYQGWLPAGALTLRGECGSLPALLNPTIPTAPADAGAYLLEVDRDGAGELRETISVPQGDARDLVLLNIINLYSAPPNNYREFIITLNCEGIGTDRLRWGIAASPNLPCGAAIVLPVIFGSSQQAFTVMLPEGVPQSFIRYSLTASPGNAVG